jgi:hypothetical protein
MSASHSLIARFRDIKPDINSYPQHLSTLGYKKYRNSFKKLNQSEVIAAESIRFSI